MAKSGKTENLSDVMTKYEFREIVDLFKQAEILPEQNLGYHDGKPNISR
jgi:hypothetical protein